MESQEFMVWSLQRCLYEVSRGGSIVLSEMLAWCFQEVQYGVYRTVSIGSPEVLVWSLQRWWYGASIGDIIAELPTIPGFKKKVLLYLFSLVPHLYLEQIIFIKTAKRTHTRREQEVAMRFTIIQCFFLT